MITSTSNSLSMLEGEIPSHYAIVTDNPWIFETGVKMFEETPAITRGLYGLKIAIGRYKELDISLIHYGIGSSELAFLLEELFRAGVRVVVKIGYGLYTMSEKPPARIAIGAVRLDKVSELTAPLEMPAVPNSELLTQITLSFNAESIPHERDLVVSVGNPLPHFEDGSLSYWWRKIGVNVIDTDTATLYIISYFKRLKAVSVVIPSIPSSEAIERKLWTAYTPNRGEVEEHKRIIEAVYESLYHMKEKAWIETTTRRLERK